MEEQTKTAVAMRIARAAIGWSQQDLADRLGVAKSTIARAETLEMSIRSELLLKAMVLFAEVGVVVDFLKPNRLTIEISSQCLDIAQESLTDESQRRSDRNLPRARREHSSSQAPNELTHLLPEADETKTPSQRQQRPDVTPTDNAGDPNWGTW
jgi:transcriptional regulator with XRE-family HTH domain